MKSRMTPVTRARWQNSEWTARAAVGGVCLGLAVLLLAAAGLLMWRARPLPGVWTGTPPDNPFAADKSVGANVDLGRYDAAGREAVLAAMEADGLRWLRQRFPWERIEPERGQFDWATWDQVVADVSRHNIGMIAVLDGSPAWARGEADAANALAPPADVRDYGSFVAAFAERYGDRITYYQVWDEPNIAPHWGDREIDPPAYAHMLREAAIQLRGADGDAVVLLAALAPNVETGGANLSELTFLDALYTWGAGEWFDIAAAQLYPFEQVAGAPPDPGRLNWKRVALLRQVMETHGDLDTAVWAVRFGWPADRLEELPGAVAQGRQDWPWLGLMAWTAWSPADPHGDYAMVDAAGKPGSTYDAVAELARQPAIAWPGVFPAGQASGHYRGAWRVTQEAADIGGSGDELGLVFWGTQLDLDIRRGDYRAFLYVTVDGGPANALPRDEAGQSYVVLYDPLGQESRVTVARDLPLGEHTARVVAERGWGQWAIAGWTVTRQEPDRLPAAAVLMLGLALVPLAVVIAQAWTGRRRLAELLGSLLTWSSRVDERVALGVTSAAVVLVLVSQSTALTLVALAILGLVLVLRPDTALPLIALSLPFYQPRKPIAGKIFSIVEILTVLCALAWVANRGLRALAAAEPHGSRPSRSAGRLRTGRAAFVLPRLSSLDWAVVTLLAWSALSLLWAEQGREAAREFRTVILEAVLFYGLLRAMLRTRGEVWRMADAWVLGATVIAAIGIGQWALGQNVITADGVWRVRGFYGSPNNLALYLGRVFPLALAVAAFARTGDTTGMHWRRWAYAAAAVLMAAALFLTYSRGAWLIGLPAALLFMAALRSKRAVVVVAGAVAIAVIVMLLFSGVSRLTSLLDSGQGTTFFRVQLWRSSLAMVRDHPILGVGLDNFLYAYRSHYVLPSAWEEFNLSHPHNLVLDFWLSLGLPGVALLLWLLFAFFRRGWHAYRGLPAASGEQMLALGLMTGMVYAIAHGLVDISFFLVDLAFAFMLTAALIQYLAGSVQSRALPAAHTVQPSVPVQDYDG